MFPTGTPLVPGVKPGLKEGTFSPGLVLPVEKPGLKGFPNREQNALLHQWQSQRWRRLTSLWVGGAVGVGNLGDGRRERAKIGTLTDADTFFFV